MSTQNIPSWIQTRCSAFGCFIGHLSPPSRGFIHLPTQLRMFGCAMAGCLSGFWRMLGVETSESGKLTWKTHRILMGFARKDDEFRYVSLPEDNFWKVVGDLFVGWSWCVYSYGYHLCWGSSPFCQEWLGFSMFNKSNPPVNKRGNGKWTRIGDAFPIEDGDVPLLCWFARGKIFPKYRGTNLKGLAVVGVSCGRLSQFIDLTSAKVGFWKKMLSPET